MSTFTLLTRPSRPSHEAFENYSFMTRNDSRGADSHLFGNCILTFALPGLGTGS